MRLVLQILETNTHKKQKKKNKNKKKITFHSASTTNHENIG